MPKDNAISVDTVRKVYGNNTEAVAGISFTIPRGEFFGFLGPNGAGKTTTMRMLATLLVPTSGTVRINGYTLGTDNHRIRQSVGFAMQGITLDLTASALENLVLIGVLYGSSPAEARERALHLLELFRLKDVAAYWVKNYSGGMKKRLDLAAALMHDPAILFLDEPTAGLDPVARLHLWKYLRTLNENGTTIILTSHDMQEVDALCERISIIDKGQIIVTGSPQQLKQRVGGTMDEVFAEYTDYSMGEEQLDPKAADQYIRG